MSTTAPPTTPSTTTITSTTSTLPTTTTTTTTTTTFNPDRVNDHAPSTWESTQDLPWLSQLDSDYDRFLWRLKRRDLTSSSHWAKDTLQLFVNYLKAASNELNPPNVGQIITLLRQLASVLVEARPIELVVGNIARRVLHCIRQEAILTTVYAGQERPEHADQFIDCVHPLLNPIFTTDVNDDNNDNTNDNNNNKSKNLPNYFSTSIKQIFETVQFNIGELQEDINNTDKNVAKTASTHIFPQEVILTYGYSRTLLAFLKRASQYRQLNIYVAESAPSLSGRRFAQQLAQNKDIKDINVTLITDADIFSIMPIVTKVFIGAHAVLANGGVIAMIGANNLCLAAAAAQIPVVVLCGGHKLAPVYAFDQETFNEHNSPAQILHFNDCLEGRIDVINPEYDYVTPDSIELFITDSGTYPPSCIYRQLSDLYSTEDYTLE